MSDNYIVISDIHLGHPLCNRENLLKVFNENFEKLIVNGDLFSCYHADKLSLEDFKIIRFLEKLQKMNKCVVVRGNHELYIKDLDKLTKLNFVDKYVWNNGRNCAIHGHSFDEFSFSNIFRSTKEKSLNFARKHNHSNIFIGHSHTPELNIYSDVTYVNTGSFINYSNNYATVSNDELYLTTFAVKQNFSLVYESNDSWGEDLKRKLA